MFEANFEVNNRIKTEHCVKHIKNLEVQIWAQIKLIIKSEKLSLYQIQMKQNLPSQSANCRSQMKQDKTKEQPKIETW